MDSTITRTIVRIITHVTMNACILYFRGSVFEVAVVHEAVFTLSMEVWVMCCDLCEIGIRGATEGLKENEV